MGTRQSQFLSSFLPFVHYSFANSKIHGTFFPFAGYVKTSVG